MTRIFLFAAAVLLTASSVLAAELPKTLIDPYLRVQAALATDSTTGVADAAKAIEQAAQPLGPTAAPIADGARKLGKAATIGDARGAFGELSAAIVDYAAKSGNEVPADVHIAFCPMNSKPWLQKEKEIKNPYYGSAMLTCGSFKK